MKQRKRIVRHKSAMTSALSRRAWCKTPPICSFATFGCALPLRLVTVSALIAAGQVAQVTYHLNRAMDNGLTQVQASEVLTHIAFYSGWPCAFSALPVVKAVFEKRPK